MSVFFSHKTGLNEFAIFVLNPSRYLPPKQSQSTSTIKTVLNLHLTSPMLASTPCHSLLYLFFHTLHVHLFTDSTLAPPFNPFHTTNTYVRKYHNPISSSIYNSPDCHISTLPHVLSLLSPVASLHSTFMPTKWIQKRHKHKQTRLIGR